MRTLLIGIVGPTASGKTSVATMLEKECGAFRIKYSDILAETARERGVPVTKESLQHISTELRATNGEDYLTRLMRDRLAKVDAPIVVVEGNRRQVDVEFLMAFAKESGRELALLYIDATFEVRFRRYQERSAKEGVPPITLEAFNALEEDECEIELPLVKEIVRKDGSIIDNSTITREELHTKVRETLGL